MRNVTSAAQVEKVCSIWKGCICKQNVVQCEEKMYSIRRATSASGGKCVWCEETASAVSVMSHLQYKERKFAVPRG